MLISIITIIRNWAGASSRVLSRLQMLLASRVAQMSEAVGYLYIELKIAISDNHRRFLVTLMVRVGESRRY